MSLAAVVLFALQCVVHSFIPEHIVYGVYHNPAGLQITILPPWAQANFTPDPIFEMRSRRLRDEPAKDMLSCESPGYLEFWYFGIC